MTRNPEPSETSLTERLNISPFGGGIRGRS